MIKIIIIKEINFNVKKFTGIWSSLVMWSNHKGLFRRFDHAPTKVHVCGGQILGCVNFKSTFMYIYDEYMVLGKLLSLMFWFIQKTISLCQTERDVSVRQRAVDLLYAMCDRTNAEEIVGEMLEYLETADYSIREEMVGFCTS